MNYFKKNWQLILVGLLIGGVAGAVQSFPDIVVTNTLKLKAETASKTPYLDASKVLRASAFGAPDSANTASAVVARDGSGNFAAGTITATLTGTASGNTTISGQTNHGVVTSGSGNVMTSTGAGSAGQVLTSNGASADPTYQDSTARKNSYEVSSIGLTASVGSSALTIALKQPDGSTDCNASSQCFIGFRSSTATAGSFNQRAITAALSVVVSSGSTLGHANGVAQYIWIYALDNAGTVELAVSSTRYDDGTIVSTTAEGGAGAADSNATIYSTTTRSNVPIRVIGRALSTQATAGTWATAPAQLALVSGIDEVGKTLPTMVAISPSGSPSGSEADIVFATKVYDSHNAYSTSTGVYTCPAAGYISVHTSIGVNGSFTTGASIAAGGTASQIDIAIYAAGAAVTQGHGWVPGNFTGLQVDSARDIHCAAGDAIKVRGSTSTSGPSWWNGTLNTFSVHYTRLD